MYRFQSWAFVSRKDDGLIQASCFSVVVEAPNLPGSKDFLAYLSLYAFMSRLRNWYEISMQSRHRELWNSDTLYMQITNELLWSRMLTHHAHRSPTSWCHGRVRSFSPYSISCGLWFQTQRWAHFHVVPLWCIRAMLCFVCSSKLKKNYGSFDLDCRHLWKVCLPWFVRLGAKEIKAAGLILWFFSFWRWRLVAILHSDDDVSLRFYYSDDDVLLQFLWS